MRKEDTTRTKILLLVYEVGLLPSTDIPVAFSYINYVVVRRLVNSLVEQGLLREVRVAGVRKRYLAITIIGIEYLGKLFGTFSDSKKVHLKYSDSLQAKKKRRLARVGEVYGYLMNNNIYVLQREKPTLASLAAVMFDNQGPLGTFSPILTITNPVAHGNDEHEPDDANCDFTPPASDPWAIERPVIENAGDLDFMLGYGIFYSSGEIREYAKSQTFYGDLAGVVDVMGRSRFVGVVFKRNEFYVIFNTRDKLMRWYEGVESKTEHAIRFMFSRYPGYEYHNTGNELGKLPAVVFGETMAVLPALVTGHKHGVDRRVKHNQYPRTYRQINASSDVYGELYFVPTEKAGQEILAATLTQGRAERYNTAATFLRSFGPGVAVRNDATYPYGHSSDHFDFAYLPVFDVKYIRWLRESKDKLLIATYAEAANAVSKTLGPKMIGGLDFREDVDGQRAKLQYKQYGLDGRETG